MWGIMDVKVLVYVDITLVTVVNFTRVMRQYSTTGMISLGLATRIVCYD